MEYRNWNNKPLRTSLLGYGCMRFPTRADGSIDEPRAEALLNTAKAAGVNYFDTAYPYHNGQSEPFVGRVIAKWERSSFYLATKMPLWTCKSLADAQRIFEEQLQRLGVEYIDFYLLHSLHKARYEQAKELGIVDWLWEQKAAGRIRNFGFSCHDNAAGFEAILRDQPWDFCQLQYNYLDRDDRAEEISGDRGYQLTEECGVPLIIMEPIKGGTLAALPADAAAPLRALHPDASDASWALRWVAGHPNVHVVLSGMSAEEQLADNLTTFDHFVLSPLLRMQLWNRRLPCCTAASRSAAPDAATACPAPWGWTSRIISASGTVWACSSSRKQSKSSGPSASRTARRPCTVCAAANARPCVPRSCPSVHRWPACRRNWTHCNTKKIPRRMTRDLFCIQMFTTDG